MLDDVVFALPYSHSLSHSVTQSVSHSLTQFFLVTPIEANAVGMHWQTSVIVVVEDALSKVAPFQLLQFLLELLVNLALCKDLFTRLGVQPQVLRVLPPRHESTSGEANWPDTH